MAFIPFSFVLKSSSFKQHREYGLETPMIARRTNMAITIGATQGVGMTARMRARSSRIIAPRSNIGLIVQVIGMEFSR
jgi:hypothetical protein